MWCFLTLTLLCAGVLVVLFSQDGLTQIINKVSFDSWLGLITALVTGFAAFFAASAAQRTAEIAEKSHITSTLHLKQKLLDDLYTLNAILNRLICIRRLDPDKPELFLISEDEHSVISSLCSNIKQGLYYFGEPYSNYGSRFISLSVTLDGQKSAQFCKEENTHTQDDEDDFLQSRQKAEKMIHDLIQQLKPMILKP